jgi:hypothetical protein
MDDLFPLLMFLIFVLAPIIEGLKRRNKKQQPPRPPQRRVPAPPTQRQQRSRTEEVTSRPRVDENASTMVPDDLWEILTGQRRPTATIPTPPPPVEKKTSWDVGYDSELEEDEEAEEENVVLEDVNVETRRARVEAQSLETITRHPEPVIISLEDNVPTSAARHAAFHQRAATAPVAVVITPARRKRLFDLNNRSELQRAILMHEILGKPKGLE